MSDTIQKIVNHHQYPKWLFKHPYLIHLHFTVLKILYTRSRVSYKSIKKLLNQLPTAGQILDVGCGEGQFLLPMAHLYKQHQFVGIDKGHGHIEFLKTYKKHKKLDHLHLLNGNLNDTLKLPHSNYALMYMIGILQYIQNPKELIKKLSDYQVASQQLMIYTPIPHRKSSYLYQQIKTQFNHYDSSQEHHQRIEEKQLIAWLTMNEYTIKEKQYFYGNIGQIGHEIYNSILILLLNLPRILKIIALIFLIILSPIFVTLQVLDSYLPNKAGNGLLIIAEKK